MAVNATAVWRARPSGSNTNGGGYDSALGGTKDYSQQNSAAASGSNGTASGTTAFSDTTANNFPADIVGNALYITGTGFTTGFYFCTARTDSAHITLDRSPGTGSAATWNMGGGWADFFTNADTSGNFGSNAATWLVPGNIVYILGSGVPNPASYTYDYTINNFFTPPAGNESTGGLIRFIGDPNTPNYATGGLPVIKNIGLVFYQTAALSVQNLYFVISSITYAGAAIIVNNGSGNLLGFFSGLVLDQFGFDAGLAPNPSSFGDSGTFVNCEVFSSAAKASTNTQYGLALQCTSGATMSAAIGVNVHDCIGPGVLLGGGGTITNSIIAKNGGIGLSITTPGNSTIVVAASNLTIDGNTGNGVEFSTQAALACTTIFNCIISNHTSGGAFGMTVDAGTTAQNNRVKGFVDYNVFYNNATNYNAISASAHDTALGTSPYVASATENYQLT